MKFTSNNIHTIGYILSLSSIMLVSYSSKAEIFKWKDATGVIQYSDLAPNTNAANPASKQLKALLAAQTMCSADDMPKAVKALKLNNNTKTQVASAIIPANARAQPTTQFANLSLTTSPTINGLTTSTGGLTTITTSTTTTSPTSTTSIINALKTNTATKPTTTTSTTTTPTTTSTSTTTAPTTSTSWIKCADEWATCQFNNSTKTVKFGGGSSWVTKSFTNYASCNSSSFGSDPIPGGSKACYVGGSATTTSVTAPTNTASTITTPTTSTSTSTAPTTTADMSLMPVVNLALMPLRTAGFGTMRIQATTEQPGGNTPDDGAFRVSCDFSHMAKDDPIVFPGQQGKAHLHTFFGNTNTNFASTSESVRTTGNSTCNGGIMNRSAYWAPSMIDTSNGAPLRPRNALMYYKHATVNEVPRGLRMIAGSMSSTGPQEHEWFECNEQYASRKSNLVSCGKGGLVSQSITFPDCWNGTALDSADHKSHMAYSTNGVCAATHPKKIPTLSMLVYYPVTTDAGTSKWRLSSDMYPTSLPAGYSSHADFMMGWDEAVHKTWVSRCINTKLDCHAHLLGDGRTYY